MTASSNVRSIDSGRPKVLEFFAGIGLARLGLEQAGFRVAWSNDYEPDKYALYAANFKDDERHTGHVFVPGDVFKIDPSTLPTDTAVAWASSPCTDLSLAGARGGIRAGESNAFWGFIEALKALRPKKGRPPVVVLENVVGLATSHGGDDLAAAIREFNHLGYSVDVLALDARRFVPQSRPRIFLVGVMNPPTATAAPKDVSAGGLRPDYLSWVHKDPSLRTHQYDRLPEPPPIKTDGLYWEIEQMSSTDERWWDAPRTEAFLQSLSRIQAERLQVLRDAQHVTYRTAYRRTRNSIALWEVRPDDIAGCLRTARGGSSKQAVVKVGRGGVQLRWMTPREYAHLMGAKDYNLEGARTSQALFAFGDAVAVPAVAWLAQHYLMPMIKGVRSGASLNEAVV